LEPEALYHSVNGCWLAWYCSVLWGHLLYVLMNNRGFSYNMQISCFRRAKNVNSCYVIDIVICKN